MLKLKARIINLEKSDRYGYYLPTYQYDVGDGNLKTCQGDLITITPFTLHQERKILINPFNRNKGTECFNLSESLLIGMLLMGVIGACDASIFLPALYLYVTALVVICFAALCHNTIQASKIDDLIQVEAITNGRNTIYTDDSEIEIERQEIVSVYSYNGQQYEYVHTSLREQYPEFGHHHYLYISEKAQNVFNEEQYAKMMKRRGVQ